MLLKIAKKILFLSQLLIITISAWLAFDLSAPAKNGSQKIFFEVERGKGAKAIAQSLKEKGMIKKIWPFLFHYEFFFYPKSIKAGEYLFTFPCPTIEILESLTKGKIYLHALTIAEGLTAKEIIDSYQSLGFGPADDFLAAFTDTESISSWDPKAQNLEGYLFPETYYLAKGLSPREIIQKMVGQFKAIFNERWRRQTANLQMTIREVVTLASLIEKETSLREEKSLVSSVFHNRLKLRMKLDCDPTIIYVLKQKGNFEGRLRSKDLMLKSPYNTYLYAGLPPSPICNPGQDSLEAALYPAADTYLYFVSRNDGSHYFSRSFREHQLAVKKFQKGK